MYEIIHTLTQINRIIEPMGSQAKADRKKLLALTVFKLRYNFPIYVSNNLKNK